MHEQRWEECTSTREGTALGLAREAFDTLGADLTAERDGEGSCDEAGVGNKGLDLLRFGFFLRM